VPRPTQSPEGWLADLKETADVPHAKQLKCVGRAIRLTSAFEGSSRTRHSIAIADVISGHKTPVGCLRCSVWSGIESGSTFSANHSSMSERSQPPEACFRGNRPFFVQRNSVERLTPTIRRTSAVLILWSSGTILGRSDAPIDARRGFDVDRGSRKRSDSCCGHGSPITLLLCARTVSSEKVCWYQENLAINAGNSRT
jgi:hypothetical protein